MKDRLVFVLQSLGLALLVVGLLFGTAGVVVADDGGNGDPVDLTRRCITCGNSCSGSNCEFGFCTGSGCYHCNCNDIIINCICI